MFINIQSRNAFKTDFIVNGLFQFQLTVVLGFVCVLKFRYLLFIAIIFLQLAYFVTLNSAKC